jgi:hypothetical protein
MSQVRGKFGGKSAAARLLSSSSEVRGVCYVGFYFFKKEKMALRGVPRDMEFFS